MGSTTPLPSTNPCSSDDETSLPFWQINVPPHLRSPTCPPFLANLSPKDFSIISTPDRDYNTLTWPEVRGIIAANRLDLFQRIPSQLRRYLGYNHTLKKLHGSIMAFIVSERLQWEQPIVSKAKPFEERAMIVHLVVWTKFVLEDDESTGDLTEEARGEIEGYVGRVFRERCGGNNVIWFKNWKSLKSVHAVEHFHVMLFDPDPEFVKEVTNGDIPLSQKV